MADYLSLPHIEALVAQGDYGGRGFLAPSSAVIALSAAFWLSDFKHWRGASYDLTDDEKDTILALVAQLENDLIETGDMYAIDMVRLGNSGVQVISTSTTTPVLFDTEFYDPEGMHSLVSNTNRINVLRAGLHIINASVFFEANVAGSRQLSLWRWDASVPTNVWLAYRLQPGAANVYNNPLQCAVQDVADVGDFYFLDVYQTSGVDLEIAGEVFTPLFSVVRF